MTIKVLAVGECMLELSHRTETELTLSVAGDTFNTAAHLARRLGDWGSVTYFTALGDGWYADFVRKRIADLGVIPALVPASGTPGAYFVRTDAFGERSFSHYRSASAARRMFQGDGPELLAAACADAKLVHLSAITLQILDPGDREVLAATLDRARTGGTRVSLDTNYRPSGWRSADEARSAVDEFAVRADIVLPSLDDERALRGAADTIHVASHYLDRGAREVVVKNGTAPTFLAWSDHTDWLPVERPTRAIDTTGAGDAFDSGYLAGRLQGDDPMAAVRLGQALAAEVVTHPGALPPELRPPLRR